MTTETRSLSAWLLDAIAEDEQVALKAGSGWRGTCPMGAFEGGGQVAVDPARVLATCAAHRAIVELHADYYGNCSICIAWDVSSPGEMETHRYPCDTLRAIASIYKDREGWQEEWAL